MAPKLLLLEAVITVERDAQKKNKKTFVTKGDSA